MFLALLSLLDAAVAAVLVAGHFGLVGFPLLYAAVYLAAKFAYFRDPFSFIDLLIGVYCVAVFFGSASFFTWLALFYLLYKIAVGTLASLS